jgi:electron-transferring-flavoprotein dehydrogenase
MKHLSKLKTQKKFEYPKPDGVLTFDRSSSVYLTGTYHTETKHKEQKNLMSMILISIPNFITIEQYL